MEYPLEIIRRRYITPLGGFSANLEQDEIGLESRHLNKTTLKPGDKVTIHTLEKNTSFSYMFRYVFNIVSILKSDSDAYAKSLNGEAVLPHEVPYKITESVRLNLIKGDLLVLNTTLSSFRKLDNRIRQ